MECCFARSKQQGIIIVLFLSMLLLFVCFSFRQSSMNFEPQPLPFRRDVAKAFQQAQDEHVYMYSAFLQIHAQTPVMPQVIITTLGRSRAISTCCFQFSNTTVVAKTPASVYFRYSDKQAAHVYVTRQFVCQIPINSTLLQPAHVTLTSNSCSSDINTYLPIQQPKIFPGGLAICAKVAHSGGLDLEKTIEWFEVQRILGVDRIVLFDMGNPDNITRVFRYYQKLGLLDLLPYELPGDPKNRSLQDSLKHTAQFDQDETMPLLDCKERLSGYDVVLSHDLDEILVPRKDISLKELIKDLLAKTPSAAGFVFNVEFFITTWPPSNPEENLLFKRYRKSTLPKMECYKYAYLPSRVNGVQTHSFSPSSSNFQSHTVPDSEAILHHYRKCPQDSWGTCSPPTHIDDVMIRYHDLDRRVQKVRLETLNSVSSG